MSFAALLSGISLSRRVGGGCYTGLRPCVNEHRIARRRIKSNDRCRQVVKMPLICHLRRAFASRMYRALTFLATKSLKCQPSPSTLIRHFDSRIQTDSSHRQIAAPWSPHWNISISSACRVQHSRFDDHANQDPNRPPTRLAELQRRNVVICTLGVGYVVYYVPQRVIILLSYLASLSSLTYSAFGRPPSQSGGVSWT